MATKKTLAEINESIAALQKEAADLIQAEKATIIEDMKKNIADFGITADELGFGVPAKAASKSKSSAPKTKAPVMYKNDEGKTWSGGRGPKPKWIKEIQDAGGDIEKYRV